MRTQLCQIGVLILAIAFAPANSYATETDAERHARIERLIEQLASPNEAPSMRGIAGSKKFGDGYDRKAQAKVVEAWETLLKEGYPAFPQLLAHETDERYSCTVEGGAADVNIDVSSVCFQIMLHQIEPYSIHWLGRQKPSGFEGGPREWIEARKDKSLRELQLELAENLLKKMHAFRSEGRVEESRQANIVMLTALITDLKSRKEAIPPKGLGERVVGLPR